MSRWYVKKKIFGRLKKYAGRKLKPIGAHGGRPVFVWKMTGRERNLCRKNFESAIYKSDI